MSLPGTWLLALMARHLDEKTVESILVPTFADLQHETLRAGTSVPRRSVALVRGYAAIVRLLVWDGLLWRSPMRRLISVLVLGGVGAALVFSTNGMSEIRAGLGAVLLAVIAASAVFRVLKLGRSYRQVFLNCLGVGMIAGTSLLAWIVVVESLTPKPWYSYALLYLFIIGWIGLASALAAALAWTPAPGAEPVHRRRLVPVVAASGTFAGCMIARSFVDGWRPYNISNFMSLASYVAFVSFFFAAFALAVYLPVMVVAGRVAPRLAARLPLAVLGGLLFPVPFLGIPLLQGSAYNVGRLGLYNPLTLLWWSSSYILAGAVMGWLLAVRPHQSASATR